MFILILYVENARQGQILPLPWARYDLAKPGTIRLMLPEHNLATISDDYDHMQNMTFGEKIDFDVILDVIRKLEEKINNN